MTLGPCSRHKSSQVLKATLIANRGTRGNLYQKKTDEDADVDYKVVALDCKDQDDSLNYTLKS